MQKRSVFLILGATLVALAVLIASAMMVWRLARRTTERVILTPQEKTIDLAAVVTQVRELNRLETAAMHVVHLGTVTQTYKLVPNAIAGDEITFLAVGDVIAGIDLSRIHQEDVWRSADGTINLRLPPPQVLVTRVSNAESKVIARKTGVLRRADVDLETRARQHAETNIRAEAIRKGVLVLASQSAEKKLADLMHTLGFEKVRFVSAPAAPLPR